MDRIQLLRNKPILKKIKNKLIFVFNKNNLDIEI
jgi:hypothetical protein